MRRTGLVLSWLVILFCLFDGGARLAGFAPYVQGMPKFGYDVALAPWIGLSLLAPPSSTPFTYRGAGRHPPDRLPGRRRRDPGPGGRPVVPLSRSDGRTGLGGPVVPEPADARVAAAGEVSRSASARRRREIPGGHDPQPHEHP
jgi:hypothetical protein